MVWFSVRDGQLEQLKVIGSDYMTKDEGMNCEATEGENSWDILDERG